MGGLKFRIERAGSQESGNINPINVGMLSRYQEKINTALAEYSSHINAEGGYILISIEPDGETMRSQYLDISEDLFNRMSDELQAK